MVAGAGPADRACPCSSLFALIQAGAGLGAWRRSAGAGRRGSSSCPASRWCRRGPYRFVDHPNYLVVVGEIAVLPLVFGLWQVALIFTLLNAAILTVRIRAENRALGPLSLALALACAPRLYRGLSPRHRQMLRLGPERPRSERRLDFRWRQCLTDTRLPSPA